MTGNPIGCTVLLDGVAISDGCSPFPADDPAVLSGLRVTWGRRSRVDQATASTCSFTVDDPLTGNRLGPALAIGRRVDVRVDTLVYPPADTSTIPLLYPTAVVNATATGTGTATSTLLGTSTRGDAVQVDYPPRQLSGSATAWDTVPRTLPGQSWRVQATVTLPAPFAGWTGWAGTVQPLTYTTPKGPGHPLPDTAAVPAGGGPVDLTFTPPPDVWLGLRVRVYPVGPKWNQLDGTTWAALGAGYAGPAPGVRVTAFGDSITAGTWLPQYSDSWFPKLAARLGFTVTANRAVGGASLHDPGSGPVLAAQVTAALAGPAFDVALILVGTNDLVNHTDAQLISQSAAAAQAAHNQLTAAGKKVCWVAVLPLGYGTSHPDTWVADLLWRRGILNAALAGIAGPRWWDTRWLFGAAPSGLVTDSSYLLDGLHPSAKGATQLADTYPGEQLNPGFTGYHPTWAELGTFTVSGVSMLAPPTGAAASALVFSGRVTDVDLSWDGTDTTRVQVIAQDWLAELANRFVGSEPWAKESLGARATRVMNLAGHPAAVTTDPGVASLQVTYRDVDRQAAAGLLQQLAVTCGGVLWTSTHLTTGATARLEDVTARRAARTLAAVNGVVTIVASSAFLATALPVSACDVDAEPVRFGLDLTDVVSVVSVQWLEQVTDPGPPAVVKPTQRTVEVSDPGLAATIGARRMGVTTHLVTEADATVQANNWLARSTTVAWRMSGLRWDTAGDLAPATITTVLQLLDGTKRIGLPVAVTDLPDWAVPVVGDTRVGVYLEGGTYTYEAGAWVLELDTSSATGSAGGTLPWQNLAAGWAWNQFDPAMSWLDLYGVTYPDV